MKNGFIKRLQYRLEYGVFLVFVAIFRIAPRSVVYAFTRALGRFTYGVIGIRRDVTLRNLRNALGDTVSESEIQRIACESYINIGMTFVEMLLFPALSGHFREMVDAGEFPVLQRARNRGAGLVLVSGHFGNWELNGASIGAAGFPLTVVAKRQSNPHIDAWVQHYRETMNMRIINPGAPVKHLIRALKNNECIGLISDQDAGSRGVFVEFFGQFASTPRGAAELALRYGSPVVASMTLRTGRGRYRSIIREIEVRDDDTVESLTQRYTKTIEEIIREHPEQYFWMHRRWKTRPTAPDSSPMAKTDRDDAPEEA